MSTQGPLKAGLCAYHGRGGEGTRAFKTSNCRKDETEKKSSSKKVCV